jgi:murein L,D-transpeptidase YcbB/YkuD
MRFLMIATLLSISVSSYADNAIRHYFESLNSGYSLPVHGDHLVATEDLETFYEQHNYQPVWYSSGKLINIATELYLAIETATADGLQPADYHNRALQQACPAEQTQNLAYCDLLFTDAFFILAQHLSAGKVNPSALSTEWPGEQRNRNLVSLLNDALAENTIKNVLASLRPRQLGYERLMSALKRLRVATRYPAWSPLPLSPSIEPGQSDPRLTAIIERLVFWGDMQEPSAPIDHYDQALQVAVQRFQSRHGLKDDGVIGEATLTAFNVDPTRRAQQIIANMERRRWLAKELGSKHVKVNIAENKLSAIKHDQTAFTQTLTVASHYRQVPAFSDVIHYVELNPDWTVPRELAGETFLPMLKADSQSLAPLKVAIFGGAEKIAADAIDWAGISQRNFNYRLVQAPGPRNALGQVAFLFPNPYKLSLHDSPDQELLATAGKSFSTGGIRVEAPLELAEWLLEDSAWSSERLTELVAKGETQALYPLQPVPVHIEYRTAWVNRQGVLNFREDIYGRDGPLYEQVISSQLIKRASP